MTAHKINPEIDHPLGWEWGFANDTIPTYLDPIKKADSGLMEYRGGYSNLEPKSQDNPKGIDFTPKPGDVVQIGDGETSEKFIYSGNPPKWSSLGNGGDTKEYTAGNGIEISDYVISVKDTNDDALMADEEGVSTIWSDYEQK